MKGVYILLIALIFFTALEAQDKTYDDEINDLYDKAFEHLYVQRDSAYYYFDKIQQKATAQADWTNVIQALIGANRNAGLFYDLKILRTNLTSLDSIFREQKEYVDSLPDNVLIINSVLYDKGNYYFKVNDFKAARGAFNQIVEAVEKIPDSLLDENLSPLLASSYSFIAKMYGDENQYDLAKRFFLKNIRYIKETNPEDIETIHKNNSLLAEVYKKEGNLIQSNEYFIKALKYNITHSGSSNSIVSVSHNIVENHLLLSHPDSATHYLKIADSYIQNTPYFLSYHHRIIAKMEAASGNFDQALKELNVALQLEKDEENANEGIAAIYNEIGLLFANYAQYEQAVLRYDLGLKQLLNSTEANTMALRIVKNKATALNKIQTSNAYLATIQATDFGLELLDSLKPSFKSEADKLLLIEEAFPLFESGLEAAYNLYESANEERYIDKAFNISEKSKSVLLLEALLTTKATKFANVPDKLLERERQLKSEINNLNKKIKEGETGSIEDILFDLNQEYRNLVSQIETDYKSYYDLKYNNKTVSIIETQQSLNADEKVISYFYGNQAVYVLGIDKTTKQFLRIPIDERINHDIAKIQEMLSDPKSDLDTLNKTTHNIYRKLVAPLLKTDHHRKIIILADGLLNYIPFSALALNSDITENNYLLEEYTISYAPSATLLFELRQRHSKNNQVLAFAPSFNSSDSKELTSKNRLLPLPNNKKEVELILSSFQGISFVDEEASLHNFRTELSNFGVLHLATHAIFNDTSPNYSYLAFTPKKNEEYLLYVSDLYNLNLESDLVTLSACESGVGELRRGEGFLSLTRGFFYSGASSICSTLWKINDASSTKLMDAFYKHLAEGDTKDGALQKAQIKFLEANRQNALIHPYYWSGFVLSGNTDRVVATDGWLWIALGTFSLLLIGFLWYRKRN